MTTEEEYDQWLAGRAPVVECVQQAIRLLGEEVAANPSLSRSERYAFALGSLTASVDKEIAAQLYALIRSAVA